MAIVKSRNRLLNSWDLSLACLISRWCLSILILMSFKSPSLSRIQRACNSFQSNIDWNNLQNTISKYVYLVNLVNTDTIKVIVLHITRRSVAYIPSDCCRMTTSPNDSVRRCALSGEFFLARLLLINKKNIKMIKSYRWIYINTAQQMLHFGENHKRSYVTLKIK